MAASAKPVIGSPSAELGFSGLNSIGGRLYEEFHKDLQGSRGAKAFREMADNCSAVGAFLWLLEALISQVTWEIKPRPGKDSPQHVEAADFAESCRIDLGSGSDGGTSLTWADTISEISSMAIFGWAFHEVIYKQRRGDSPVGVFVDEYERARHTSRYNDGRLGWAGIEPRAQESLDRWYFDQSGRAIALCQRTVGKTATIPLSKGLLFRARSRKNSPEGYSLLRAAYVDWYHVREIRSFEGIGIERDLCGVPVMQVPEEVTVPESGGTDEERAALQAKYDAAKLTVRRLRNNEYAGIVMPHRYLAGQPGNIPSGWELGLMSSAGQRQYNTSDIIKRYESRILMSLLAEFILLGTDRVGSFALGDVKMDVLAYAAYAFLRKITGVFNEVAIPRLMRLNGFADADLWPVLTHGPIATPDLTHIANYLSQLIASAVLTPGPEIERWVRERAGLPPAESADAAPADPARAIAGEDQAQRESARLVHIATSKARKALGRTPTDDEVIAAYHAMRESVDAAFYRRFAV